MEVLASLADFRELYIEASARAETVKYNTCLRHRPE
jgi:hypothetical protein